jgi:hypothetical protein
MIPEIDEKMWKEGDRWDNINIIYTKINDYKLIELLDFYYVLYINEF